MGDARIVNCLFDGAEARALVDFEVAYVGHPAADVGYSVFVDELQRQNTPQPLPGIGTADEAWARWAHATGRNLVDRDYWTAFGATVLGITATRAMIQWGLAGPSVEDSNPVVAAWESALARAAAQ
jgi:aminoglycoside phosphotransferase (APT) family kinase protein